jgi:hypothetical protein
MSTRLGPRWLPMFHIPKGTPYHVENSITGGLNRAAAGGYDSIDLDWQLTMPDPSCDYCAALRRPCIGHPVNTHWLRPLLRDGFRDPEHELGRFHRVDRMTLPQALRLVAGPGYRIHLPQVMFREAAERDLKVAAEVKHPRYSDHEVMRRFVDVARDNGCAMRIMKLSDGAKPLATLRAAKAVDAQTIVIARGPIPDSWRPYVDFQRGPARYWR